MKIYKAIANKTSEPPLHNKVTMFVEGESYRVAPTKNPNFAHIIGKFQNRKGTMRNRNHSVLLEVARGHLTFI